MAAVAEDLCFYSVLGLCKKASDSEIRDAYRKLALKWHPDRWMKDPVVTGQAKRRFQKIQEAYSVLSDKRKRKIYDAGILGFLGDDDDEGFCDFMQEMILMMEKVNSQSKKEADSFGNLQGLLREMMAQNKLDNFGLGGDTGQTPPQKRTRFTA